MVSDAQAGLKAAISAVMIGVTWQRCRAYFLHNVLGVVPKGSAGMVAAAICTIFAQPDAEHVRESSTSSPPCSASSSQGRRDAA